MRNAALVLGIVGGLIAMVVGFFGYGYTVLTETHVEVAQAFGVVDDASLVRLASFVAPLLAIAGGAMARARALWGGVMLLASAGLMYAAFGFGVFTMFPIGFCAVAGLLAIAAGRPDEEKAHF
ncbi:hypothetical protein [Pararhodobacter aggregans]|uniref:DUF423 domain-containing protein n=1 Tax=Pararhodobacter aggregans TaxID=404875 RepID=A0A2T7UW41_9RHOB|nr:hypothetical protein [Pararhodobacter aggregans]PTX04663.1 hypothetical protein C8N33_10172 [Pararhodobacter aggregans]PVE49003.1 hypothetical protein DDE23_00925 [Pararhodobacter aggregans]